MSSQQLIEEGKQLINEMRFAEAERRFQQSLEQDSQSIEALYWLSWISFMALQNDQASKYLEQALKIQPDDARTVALKGVYLLTYGDPQQAIEQLERARQIDPNLQMIYSGLARAYRDAGKLDMAEEAARKAIALKPNDFMSHFNLSFILSRTGRIRDGVRELKECIRINPFYVQPYLILGELYVRAGQERSAIALSRHGLKQNPKAFPLRERLCDFYASKTRYDLAYREAVELVTRRNFYGDFLRLGTYGVAIGAIDKAQKAFEGLRRQEASKWWGLSLDQLYEKTKIPKPPDAIFQQVENCWNEVPTNWIRPITK